MKKTEIIEQVLAIRDTARTNMFDLVAVQRIAMEMEYYALVLWLEDHKKQYGNLILTGQLDYDEEGAE